MAAFFGQMSFDQTGMQACLAPWVTRPLPAKKSTKVGKKVLRSSFEQFFYLMSTLECLKRDWGWNFGNRKKRCSFPRFSRQRTCDRGMGLLSRLTPPCRPFPDPRLGQSAGKNHPGALADSGMFDHHSEGPSQARRRLSRASIPMPPRRAAAGSGTAAAVKLTLS